MNAMIVSITTVTEEVVINGYTELLFRGVGGWREVSNCYHLLKTIHTL